MITSNCETDFVSKVHDTLLNTMTYTDNALKLHLPDVG